MCHNAKIYNDEDTVYYKQAEKLLNTGLKLLNKVFVFCFVILNFIIHKNIKILGSNFVSGSKIC
jgi:hypothetical protein